VTICSACGDLKELTDVTDADRRLQGQIDFALRPRSAECVPR
jgi:hypothetical protein